MKQKMAPFNLELLKLSEEQKKIMTPITSLDMFDGPGGQFHEEGLFSTEIFGRPGDRKRSVAFSYVDLRLPIFHPVIFKNLCRLKDLYRAIMAGTAYAIFDEKEKDFVRSDEIEGDTGYAFFASRYYDIKFKRTGSGARDKRIAVIERYPNRALIDAYVVIPPSFRELDIDTDGRTRMDEVNNFYQRMVAIARTLPKRVPEGEEIVLYDRARFQLQQAAIQIYDYIENLLSNKRGFIQQRFASRRIFNGTRGVFTSRNVVAEDLGSDNYPGFMDTAVGLYQHSKAILPVSVYCLTNSILGDVFNTRSDQVELVNKKTLEKEWVAVDSSTIDDWYSPQGIEKLIESMSTIERRARPVEIEGHYLGLVYEDGKHFKIFRSLSELPEHLSKDNVRPLTYIELVYLSGYKIWNDHYATATRYPVAGLGSIIPTKAYVMTTLPAGRRIELDNDWQPITDGPAALEYPIFPEKGNPQYHDSVAVPPPALEGMVADFDGDTNSYTALYTEDGKEEVRKYLKSKEAYILPDGRPAFSTNTHTVNLALRNITGNPV